MPSDRAELDAAGSAGPAGSGLGPPGPVLLSIETAGAACSAAILRGAVVLAAERRAMRYGHAEALLPMIERVAAEAGVPPGGLQVVAVAVGPGGFTGIRAGLAAANGIALAVGARLTGISSFAAVAAVAGGGGSCSRPLLVALDSRRADLYVQPFTADGVAPLSEPVALLPDRLAAHVVDLIGEGPLLLAGDAAEAAFAALDAAGIGAALAPHSAPDALGVAAAALRQLQTGAAIRPMRPLYLRPPDVTLAGPRERRPQPPR